MLCGAVKTVCIYKCAVYGCLRLSRQWASLPGRECHLYAPSVLQKAGKMAGGATEDALAFPCGGINLSVTAADHYSGQPLACLPASPSAQPPAIYQPP